MDINIIAGKNSEINNQFVFSKLRSRDKSKKHVIIAPDRSLFSLEQRLFDETGESCFFDVSVTSISKLSKSLLTKINNKHILTKQSGVALVKTLLINNKDRLSAFNKSSASNGFSSALFETICLYKSCNINCDDVYVDDTSSHSNLKQKDIKLIYSEYEKFLQNDYTDSFNQLNFFADNIDKEFCKDTIFYFVEFDDFTSIMYRIISKLAKYSDGLFISTTYGKENNNSNIYSNKVYYDLITLFKSDGLTYNIHKISDNLSSLDNHLANNLLAYSPKKFNGDNYKIAINCFDNHSDEIKYTVAKIYIEVINDKSLTFSDFAIVLPNILDYMSTIKRELNNYGISYFVDQNKIMSEHILIRNLLDMCRVIMGDFTVSDFLNLLKSSLLSFDIAKVNDYDNILHKKGARGYECLNAKLTDNEEITEFINLIKDCRSKISVENTCEEFYNTIIVNLYDFIINRKGNYLNNLDVLESRIFSQVLDKFDSVNTDFLRVFKCNQTSFKDFVDTYFAYFESTNINMPPITSNSLFIADFNSSYVTTYKYIYILGCNEGILPKLKLDNGLLSDEEIARLPNAGKINPTIAMLNKRKIFKLFELIFKAKKKLILSFLTANNKGKLYPNNLILSLIKILNIDINNGSVDLDQINNSLHKLNVDNIVFNNLTEKVSLNNILTLQKNKQTYYEYPNFALLLNTLISTNDNDKLKEYLNNVKITYDNISSMNVFRNNTTSISQIETYFNCPYLHFVRYGLKLNKKQEYKLEANDIGTIIHSVLKELIPFILSNEENKDLIIKKSYEILENILSSDEYIEMTNNPVNAYIIKSLYKELIRVCTALLIEIKSSSFRPVPKYLEYSFNPNSLKIKGIKIKGSIDRVDVCNNDFIVIDYKTGNNSFNNYNEVYSGKKLQLLIYAKAFANETKLGLKGVYYFPLSNGFTKDDNSSNYRLNGVTYKSKENIVKLDNNLSASSVKSQVVNISTTKDGEFSKNNYYNYMCLEKDDFDYLVSFAINQVDKAITRILLGDISPKPIRNGQNKTCNYCEYRGLCNYQDNNDNIQITIASIEELKSKGDRLW